MNKIGESLSDDLQDVAHEAHVADLRLLLQLQLIEDVEQVHVRQVVPAQHPQHPQEVALHPRQLAPLARLSLGHSVEEGVHLVGGDVGVELAGALVENLVELPAGDFEAAGGEQPLQHLLEPLLPADRLQHLVEDVRTDVPPVLLPALDIRTLLRFLVRTRTRRRRLLPRLLPRTPRLGGGLGGLLGLELRIEVEGGGGRREGGRVGEAERLPAVFLVGVDVEGGIEGGGGVHLGHVLAEIALKWQHQINIILSPRIQGLVAQFPTQKSPHFSPRPPSPQPIIFSSPKMKISMRKLLSSIFYNTHEFASKLFPGGRVRSLLPVWRSHRGCSQIISVDLGQQWQESRWWEVEEKQNINSKSGHCGHCCRICFNRQLKLSRMLMCSSQIRFTYEANPDPLEQFPERLSCISQLRVPSLSRSFSKDSPRPSMFSSQYLCRRDLAAARCCLRQWTMRRQASLNLMKLLSQEVGQSVSRDRMRSGWDSRAHLRYRRRSSRSEQSSSSRRSLQQLLISNMLTGSTRSQFQLSKPASIYLTIIKESSRKICRVLPKTQFLTPYSAI